MRIFHGLGNINGSAACLAQAERELGLESFCVGYRDKGIDNDPDIFCHPSIYPPYNYQEFKYFSKLFDIFVFYGLYSFAGSSLADVPLLKKLGKKIIFYFRGCDIRNSVLNIANNPYGMCASCWPQTCQVTPQHREIIDRYADDIWVSTKDLLLSAPTARYIPQAVDIKKIPYYFTPYNDSFINIIHSPSRPHLKGTKEIIAAIQKLIDKKYPIHLTLLTGIPWHTAQLKTRNSHIAIDQIKCGWYGVASVEYLAQGKPTLCYLDKKLIDTNQNIPIINVTPSVIEEDIENLINNHDRWQDIAMRSRQYVVKNHDSIEIAKTTKKIYESLG